METWREIAGFSGVYMVSDQGRLLSFARSESGSVLRLELRNTGYYGKVVTRNGTRHHLFVHIEVCTAFNGAKPEWAQVCRHLDDDKSNNTPDNLEWGTHADNRKDCVRNGNQPRGAGHHNATLTDSDVLEIRAALRAGSTPGQLSSRYGITRENVYYIRDRKTWTHLP